jgi:hypothetical protein
MTVEWMGARSATLPRRTKMPNLWSMQEVRRLRELAAAGMPIDSIAATLRRTRSAIKNKAGLHAISLRNATPSRS